MVNYNLLNNSYAVIFVFLDYLHYMKHSFHHSDDNSLIAFIKQSNTHTFLFYVINSTSTVNSKKCFIILICRMSTAIKAKKSVQHWPYTADEHNTGNHQCTKLLTIR